MYYSKMPYEITIDETKMNLKDCVEICMKICPSNRMNKKCFDIEDGNAIINSNNCIGCKICVAKCPEGVITITKI